MFSLIIVLVSIALVVALVAATIYYGGSVFQSSGPKATAATLSAQAAQIAAAGSIADAQGVGWPAGAGPQFSQPYLATMPVPPAKAYLSGATGASDWTYYLAPTQAHHFVLKNKIKKDVCLAVNKQQGFVGIPAAWDGQSVIQCFGAAEPYTFFYAPPGSTVAQNGAALDQSVQEGSTQLSTSPAPVVAIDSDSPGSSVPVSTASPGYPRSCPSGNVINSGTCADPGASGVGGGGSANISFDCSGTYTTNSATASCSVTNSMTNPMKITSVVAYSNNTSNAASTTGCVNTVLAPGATCVFNATATLAQAATHPTVITANITYGATATEGATSKTSQPLTAAPSGPIALDNFTSTTGPLASHALDAGGMWEAAPGISGANNGAGAYTLDGSGLAVPTGYWQQVNNNNIALASGSGDFDNGYVEGVFNRTAYAGSRSVFARLIVRQDPYDPWVHYMATAELYNDRTIVYWHTPDADLAEVTLPAITSGSFTLRVEMQDYRAKVYLNGALALDYTGTTAAGKVSGPGKVGFALADDLSTSFKTIRLDKFEADTFK